MSTEMHPVEPSGSGDATTSGAARFSLVLAVVGVVLLPVFLGLAAVALGSASLRAMADAPAAKGRGAAGAAIGLGILTVVAGVIGWAVHGSWEWSIWELLG